MALMVRVKPDKIRCPNGDDYEKAHWILNSSDDEIKNINIMDILHRATY